MSLEGKIAIVTGSSRGIGFAIAKEFAENKGAIVIVCSRSHVRAARAAAQINGKTFAAKLDVTNDTSIKKFILIKRFHRLLWAHRNYMII